MSNNTTSNCLDPIGSKFITYLGLDQVFVIFAVFGDGLPAPKKGPDEFLAGAIQDLRLEERQRSYVQLIANLHCVFLGRFIAASNLK